MVKEKSRNKEIARVVIFLIIFESLNAFITFSDYWVCGITFFVFWTLVIIAFGALTISSIIHEFKKN